MTLVVVAMMTMMVGCSSTSKRTTDEGLVIDDGNMSIDPFYQVPNQGEGGSLFSSEPNVSDTSSSLNKTVLALLSHAKQQEKSGNPEGAASVIERALRIDPRNPQLWHRLALLRLQQGQYSLASSLASKSNALSRNDPVLKKMNQRVIQQAKILGGG
jgi:tetratricopeptide (TPR) repeat protein